MHESILIIFFRLHFSLWIFLVSCHKNQIDHLGLIIKILNDNRFYYYSKVIE